MGIGALMLDLESTELSAVERDLLSNSEVGGVILFSRNYQSPAQLSQLVRDIRGANPEIIIAVDQEGGRVQRFRDGFTRLPPMRCLGDEYERSPATAQRCAERAGWLMASELIAHDIDLSFAPVLDLDSGVSSVIGDRAFACSPDAVRELVGAFIDGMHAAGMISTGKHFPGHGAVAADSHVALPVDDRSFDEISETDMQPFAQLVDKLDAVMPAHVIYPAVDDQPAGFSKRWIQGILREQLGFDGVVFSDDLSMEGASVAGSYPQRAQVALDAGCDMVLVCNNRDGALAVLQYLKETAHAGSPRLQKLRHSGRVSLDLKQDPQWLQAVNDIQNLVQGSSTPST